MRLENGWLSGVTRVPSPYHDDRPENELPSLLVVHNISLPPGEFGGPYIDQLFTGTLDAAAHPYFADICHLHVSAHCLIRRDGSIVQYVSFDKRAWHAGVSHFEGRERCNDFSIGIELEGTDTLPFTTEQYSQLATMTRLLCRAYPITPSRITGHSDIAPGRKTDPGPAFDWDFFQHLWQAHLD
ncbi:1,6-anhydro-N-acetylmuramyl-L-alanine amidase AmpD [Prodigiosinella confusarubida]|uniref:1,6-anhydro-N-acetylmuramyl-L-alanine amidase AmpD n=1 Tax=Serratia sp. (strain ATCC 39006) TaxID=104623 RepID=A0A2I5TGS8_SERS3|nr:MULTISPECIES: 1,6-anhydro-N-acetylmuramyl-L-alanine amidase AmpD [Enterobacterales]AUG99453.1 1,6-anhydro-N-acetylmuramyl-L-alanine amidase AmpD [Serratia sp. ATCC 39006]AUH03771.1 1,6-anhydro-N-acetylmuramyl-L-alanine amidase AmpD [Serratia sp. ATCC 39006]WJV53284.1 1,6-anhydro-N-acetylmuramyl-L-alanine amidase AmpD [Prodigiosinella sp. LS101]WJV57645.1 1,6-anhydro-N-acetylmuramyl-L-alanine amidase AmpD [Pectobacteriaceae bacterium C111]